MKLKRILMLCLFFAGVPLMVLMLSGQQSAMEEQVLFIVLKEVKPEFSEEMIKAQAIIARTNLLWSEQQGEEIPESISQQDLTNLLSSNGGSEFYALVEKCVADTQDLILVYDGACIHAPFHYASAGMTRDGAESLGDTYTYLKSASCRQDVQADSFLSVQYFEKDKFPQEVEITMRDESGYVLEVTVDEDVMSGEEFRQQYGLQSSCFSVKETEQGMRVVCKGVGHGYGLSQYTANIMAENGKDYEKILSFFYNGIRIEKNDHTTDE